MYLTSMNSESRFEYNPLDEKNQKEAKLFKSNQNSWPTKGIGRSLEENCLQKAVSLI